MAESSETRKFSSRERLGVAVIVILVLVVGLLAGAIISSAISSDSRSPGDSAALAEIGAVSESTTVPSAAAAAEQVPPAPPAETRVETRNFLIIPVPIEPPTTSTTLDLSQFCTMPDLRGFYQSGNWNNNPDAVTSKVWMECGIQPIPRGSEYTNFHTSSCLDSSLPYSDNWTSFRVVSQDPAPGSLLRRVTGVVSYSYRWNWQTGSPTSGYSRGGSTEPC